MSTSAAFEVTEAKTYCLQGLLASTEVWRASLTLKVIEVNIE